MGDDLTTVTLTSVERSMLSMTLAHIAAMVQLQKLRFIERNDEIVSAEMRELLGVIAVQSEETQVILRRIGHDPIMQLLARLEGKL